MGRREGERGEEVEEEEEKGSEWFFPTSPRALACHQLTLYGTLLELRERPWKVPTLRLTVR